MDFNDVIKTVERVAPRALDNYLVAIRQGETLFKSADITTPLRMAHFLAQALRMSFLSAKAFRLFWDQKVNAGFSACAGSVTKLGLIRFGCC